VGRLPVSVPLGQDGQLFISFTHARLFAAAREIRCQAPPWVLFPSQKRQCKCTIPWYIESLVHGTCITQSIKTPYSSYSVHLADELVDVLFTVAQVAAFDKVLELPLAEPARRAVELERPQEVRRLLEVGPNGVDLVNHIFHTDHTVLAEVGLNNLVISQRQTLLVNLAITTLCTRVSTSSRLPEWKTLTVDELANGLLVGVAVGDKRLNNLQHLHGSLGKLDEDTVVDLEQTEQLQSLALLGIDLVDTLDADDKRKLRLGRNVEAVAALGLAGETNLLPLGVAVLLDILLSACEDDLALLLALVCCILSAQSTAAACGME
jgi:hypothetical protein